MVEQCSLQRALTSDEGRLITRDSSNFVFNRVPALVQHYSTRVQHSSLAMSAEP